MSEHIYILGSNSFSGAHFARFALNKGFTVTGVSRSPEPHSVFLPYLDSKRRDRERFFFLRADLNHDLDMLTTCMERAKPAYVVNFVAQGMVAESWLHPDQWLRTNTLSPLLLYEYLRHCPWLCKFVQISTPEVYGSTAGLMRESVHYEPSTPYAVSKAAADMNLMCFFRAYNFPVVFTRAANVFGPCQQLYRIIPRTVLRFLTGGIVELHGGGQSVRSFIHIDDVVDATFRVMLHGDPGEIFHISTTRTISIHDLVHLIARMMEVDPGKHIRVSGERLGKDAAYLLDAAKLRQTLDWRDKHSLEDGIVDVVRWMRRNLSTLAALPQDYQHKE